MNVVGGMKTVAPVRRCLERRKRVRQVSCGENG